MSLVKRVCVDRSIAWFPAGNFILVSLFQEAVFGSIKRFLLDHAATNALPVGLISLTDFSFFWVRRSYIPRMSVSDDVLVARLMLLKFN